MALGKLLDLSMPPSPNFKNGVVVELNEMIHVTNMHSVLYIRSSEKILTIITIKVGSMR